MSEVYHPDSAPRSAMLERPSATQEFTSITHIHHSALPARHGKPLSVVLDATFRFADFRMIPLGDLDLRREVDRSIAAIRHRRGCAVRVYSANVDGRKSTMTVALYQGRNSEEVWRHELEQYATFRHPNLVQIYATAMSGQLYATVFHDELLPLDETLRVYRNSPIF
ncbi:hypothetical protein C8R47DRAFT_1088769 [Mycena vitilis]|nr:hypothetical protein C8R47DRAFT_1088769 [Mycena vitilis]